MNTLGVRVGRRLLPVLAVVAVLVVGPWAGPAAAQSFARETPFHGVFVLITMDRTLWLPYEYGTGFFFDAVGDAYTASNVVRDAVKNRNLMLIAVVDGAEYAVHVECWNPDSKDRTRTPTRDVAVVHVGADVPEFPLWSYHPATSPLAVIPMALAAGGPPTAGQPVRVVAFGARREDRILEQETPGRVRGVLRTGDGTELLALEFPSGGQPPDGASGAPVVDGAGDVIGIAVWEAAGEHSQDTTDVGVAAASLGCVAALPSGQTSPIPAPVRPL